MSHHVKDFCEGERCSFRLEDGSCCGELATHKVGEEDTAPSNMHNLTAYLCCYHFNLVMGPMAKRVHGCD